MEREAMARLPSDEVVEEFDLPPFQRFTL